MSNPITPQVAPGWFADPSASVAGQQRWWDGTQWTDQVQNPYAPDTSSVVGPLKAPAGTSTSTVQIWLIVGIFVFQLLTSVLYFATVDFSGYLRATMDLAESGSESSSDVFALYGYLFTPAYALVLATGVLGYVGTAALAFFDSRTLAARGVPKPFHWALAFIPSYGSLVYVIGRSVVVRRRTGTGLAPLWVYASLFVIGTVGSIIWAVATFSSMIGNFSQYLT